VEDDDDTAMVAGREAQEAKNWSGKIFALLVGMTIAVGPAIVTGWYNLKKTRIEAAVASEASKKEASTSYETLAQPLEQFRSAITILDWRVQKLENEQSAHESLGPISPEPLVEPALKKPVPQTLIEADVVAATAAAAGKKD
jgi:hypothetical protein